MAAETAALRSGAFVAPRPVEAAPARPVPIAQPAVPPAPDAPPPRARGRVPSLIERVTGVGRARPAAAPPPERAPQPQPAPVAARSVPPRLTPLEPEERLGASKEDDLLDIPAFLRRQAN
jgi:cell division protein FtsZ